MIAHADLSNHYWAEVVAAAYMKNQMQSTAIKKIRPHMSDHGMIENQM